MTASELAEPVEAPSWDLVEWVAMVYPCPDCKDAGLNLRPPCPRCDNTREFIIRCDRTLYS